MVKILSLQASQIRLPRIFFVRRILVTLATWDEAPVSSCYLEEKKLVSKMIKIFKKIRKLYLGLTKELDLWRQIFLN